MKTIAIIVEGKTEKVFVSCLQAFLKNRLAGKTPKLKAYMPGNGGPIPKEAALKRMVKNHLNGRNAADAVIALTDLHGRNDFSDAHDAKKKMGEWVGTNEKRFYPHVAVHEFEAWLLPYWSKILELAGPKKSVPELAANPETVNHNRPPSQRLNDLFMTGKFHRSYVKVRDAQSILAGQDLMVAINRCAELKAFVNSIFAICGEEKLP